MMRKDALLPRTATTIALAFLLVALLACSSSSPEEQQLKERIDALEADVGFDVLVPQYVPSDLRALPETDNQSEGEAVLMYWQTDGEESTTKQARLFALLVIHRLDPEGKLCPPCADDPDESFQPITLNGIPAAIQEGPSGEGRVGEAVHFRSGQLKIIVDLTWELPASAPQELTDDMRREALKIAESMLE